MVIFLFSCISCHPRLYFIHIPKTGGTTLRLLLEMHVHTSEIFPFRNDRNAKGPVKEDLVSGHFPYWFCKNLDPDFDRAFKVTILRDPIERYLSFLRAKKRGLSPDTDLESIFKVHYKKANKIAKGLVDNALCRHLSSNPRLEGEALLASAIQTLNELDCVLLFEHFTQDVIHLFSRLGIEWSEEDIPQINATMKEPVSQSLLEEIRQLNLLDIRLVEYARKHLKPKETEYRFRSHDFNQHSKKTDFVDFTFDYPLQGAGWGYREGIYSVGCQEWIYRWVMDRPADISFNLLEGIDYELVFLAEPLTGEIHPEVAVNGTSIEIMQMDRKPISTYRGKIGKELISQGLTRLTFYSPKSFPYSNIHPDSPNRNYPPVSFAVYRIRINPLGNSNW